MIAATDRLAPEVAEAKPSGWEALGQTTGLIVVLVFSVTAYAFVLQNMWGWFIVPVFHLPSITLAEAVGLDLMVSLLRINNPTTKTEGETIGDILTKGLGKVFGLAGSCLLLGWIAHLLLP
jgi:hypothetical protein